MHARISCLAPLRGSRSFSKTIPSCYEYVYTLEPMLSNRILKLAFQYGDSQQRRFFARSFCRSSSGSFTTSRLSLSKSNKIHSSAQKLNSASTTQCEFTPPEPLVVQAANVNTPRPSSEALRMIFVASAIPMVGFGFMDNLVMIQAGQYIDSTLGVSLGLATMTAAAAGQVVSDVSGVVFGGALERFLHGTKLIQNPLLTTAQRQLAICRNVSMFGAVVGVVIGCALGALSLLFVDLDKRGRIQHAIMLREIVDDMIAEQLLVEGNHNLKVKSCIVYVEHDADFSMPANEGESSATSSKRTRMQALHEASSPAVQQCATERQVLLEDNAKILYIPVSKDGRLLAVLQLNLLEEDTADASNTNTNNVSKGFTQEDQRIAQVMAQHIAIFMNRMAKE
jgi:hypothetical protein